MDAVPPKRGGSPRSVAQVGILPKLRYSRVSGPHRRRTGQTPVSSGMHNPCAGWPMCRQDDGSLQKNIANKLQQIKTKLPYLWAVLGLTTTDAGYPATDEKSPLSLLKLHKLEMILT